MDWLLAVADDDDGMARASSSLGVGGMIATEDFDGGAAASASAITMAFTSFLLSTFWFRRGISVRAFFLRLLLFLLLLLLLLLESFGARCVVWMMEIFSVSSEPRLLVVDEGMSCFDVVVMIHVEYETEDIYITKCHQKNEYKSREREREEYSMM